MIRGQPADAAASGAANQPIAPAGSATGDVTADDLVDHSRANWGGPGGEITDEHGLHIWQYDMYIEPDAFVDSGFLSVDVNPAETIFEMLINLGWGLYRMLVQAVIWFIDWTLSFSWFDWMTAPVMTVGQGIHRIVGTFDDPYSTETTLTVGLLTITAFVCGMWMLRGRWSLGIAELAIALTIASLASGLLANPVSLVAGDNGYVRHAHAFGFELANTITHGRPLTIDCGQRADGQPTCPETEPGGADEQDDETTAVRADLNDQLIDTLVRRPAQIVNFGVVVDDISTACTETYNELLGTPPGDYSHDGDAAGELEECSPEAAEATINPNSAQVLAIVVIFVGGLFLLVFAVVLTGGVLLAGVSALFQSLKAIVVLVIAVLPGGARASLWRTIADVIVALIIVSFSIVFVVVYLEIIDLMLRYGSGVGENPVETFFIIDLVILAGVIVFWRARSSVARASERLAQGFSRRPGAGAPTRLPAHGSAQPGPAADPGGRAAAGTVRAARKAGTSIARLPRNRRVRKLEKMNYVLTKRDYRKYKREDE